MEIRSERAGDVDQICGGRYGNKIDVRWTEGTGYWKPDARGRERAMSTRCEI